MSDSESAKPDAGEPTPPEAVFTKEPQPELPLEQRKLKAGMTKNRVGIWITVGGFAIIMIIVGIVGILTKSR